MYSIELVTQSRDSTLLAQFSLSPFGFLVILYIYIYIYEVLKRKKVERMNILRILGKL